jgi:uridine kinase
VFDFREDRPVHEAARTAPADAILLFDGVFLFRPELNHYWDYRVFVHVPFEVALTRAVSRDVVLFGSAAEVVIRYRQRYFPAQRSYLAAVRPELLADIVVENQDWDEPRVVVPRVGDARQPLS